MKLYLMLFYTGSAASAYVFAIAYEGYIPFTKGESSLLITGRYRYIAVTITITSQWVDGVSNHLPHDYLLNRLFRHRSKKTSKLCVTGLCAGNSPGTGEIPAQMASNAENVSIWWRHHDFFHGTHKGRIMATPSAWGMMWDGVSFVSSKSELCCRDGREQFIMILLQQLVFYISKFCVYCVFQSSVSDVYFKILCVLYTCIWGLRVICMSESCVHCVFYFCLYCVFQSSVCIVYLRVLPVV